MIVAKVLKPEHEAAGFTFEELDDHIATLLHNGVEVGSWLVTKTGPTITDIHAEADMYIKYNKGGTA